MTPLATYAFSGRNVRTNNDPISPLFVAKDVCDALGYERSRDAIAQHVDPEDLTKLPVDTGYGVKDMLAVNESGLYALIFGSKLPSAQKFKRWVTSEVLPSIRRTGSYTLPRKTISVEQQHAIRSAIARRAACSCRHYQTIYRALYEHFRIPRYTELPASRFDEAIDFINYADLSVPVATSAVVAPETALPDGALVLDKTDAKRIMDFVYCWRYLHKPELEAILHLLKTFRAPRAALFFQVVSELDMPALEDTLERYGYSVKEMPCYKYLMNSRGWPAASAPRNNH